jgi:hypothetical protein
MRGLLFTLGSAGLLVFSGCDNRSSSGTGEESPANDKVPSGPIRLQGEPPEEFWGQKFRYTLQEKLTDGKMIQSTLGRQMTEALTSDSSEAAEVEIVSATKRKMRITESKTRQTRSLLKGVDLMPALQEDKDNEGEEEGEDQEKVETDQSKLIDKDLDGTLTDGIWKFALADGEPSKEEQEALVKISWGADDDVAYPAKRIKFGEVFKMKTEGMAGLGGMLEHDIGGQVRGYLKEIVELHGHRCALILLDIDVHGKMDMRGEAVQVTFKLKGQVYRSLDVFEDLKRVLKGTISFGGDFDAFSISSQGNVSIRSELSPTSR